MKRRDVVISVLVIAAMSALAVTIALAPVGRDGSVMGWTAAVLFVPLFVFAAGSVLGTVRALRARNAALPDE
jgi:hypothetical protein